MSYFNYFRLLKYTRGGYIQLVANPKNSKVKFPFVHILVKPAQCVKLPYLKNVSKSCGHPSTPPNLPPGIFLKLPSRDYKAILAGEEHGCRSGYLGSKHLTGKFQQRESICMPAYHTPSALNH